MAPKAKTQPPAPPAQPDSSVPSSMRFKRGISFNVYLPFDELYIKDEFEKIALAEHRSISEVVVNMLREYLDKKRKTA